MRSENKDIKVTARKDFDTGKWAVYAGWKRMSWGLRHKDVKAMKDRIQRLVDNDPWFTYHY